MEQKMGKYMEGVQYQYTLIGRTTYIRCFSPHVMAIFDWIYRWCSHNLKHNQCLPSGRHLHGTPADGGVICVRCFLYDWSWFWELFLRPRFGKMNRIVGEKCTHVYQRYVERNHGCHSNCASLFRIFVPQNHALPFFYSTLEKTTVVSRDCSRGTTIFRRFEDRWSQNAYFFCLWRASLR